MVKSLTILLLLPIAAFAQLPQFQLQPGAFPVEINGVQMQQPWAGGIEYTTPELCDLDNDGDLDFYTGAPGYYIGYFKNIGLANCPEFQYVTYQVDSLHPFMDVDFVDINNDGLKDAVLGGYCYLNMGTSSQFNFCGDPDTLFDTAGNQLICPRTAAVDIDLDGDRDILAGQTNGYIRFYQNIGTSTNYSFQLGSSNWLNSSVTGGHADPCFSDLDSDGDLDLLVGTGAGTIYYYRNDGTAQNPSMTYVTNNYFGINVQMDASPELADFDGDGDLDLFVGRSPDEGQNPTQGDVYFYENVGTPQVPDFQFVTTNYLSWDCGWGATPRLVDIDGDGDPDLFSRLGSHMIYYQNQGTLQNPRFVYQSSTFGNVNIIDCTPWFVDIDGDGDYDLLVGEGDIPGPPGLHLYLNQGTPQNPNFIHITDDLVPGVFTQNSVILSPWTADIDADGDQDLFVCDGGTLYYFENTGSSTRFHFQLVSTNWQNIGSTTLAARNGFFYDMDRDGDLDFFIDTEDSYTWDERFLFYRNVGSPQNAQMVLESEDFFPEIMIRKPAPFILDMDQDGDGDMFLGDQAGGIRYFKNATGDTTAVLQPTKMRPRPCRATLTIGPNPSNPISLISFSLPSPQEVSLSVYNILGSKIATLVSGKQSAGDHTVSWNATGNASGVYLVRLTTPGEEVTQKVVVVK
ncbi:MAG: FG-GAP-like repeat-containing protein [bacterium]|nr:FG-GAP-like repeat-containing protein [bacterium]